VCVNVSYMTSNCGFEVFPGVTTNEIASGPVLVSQKLLRVE